MLRYLCIRQLVPQTGTGVTAKYPNSSNYFNIKMQVLRRFGERGRVQLVYMKWLDIDID